MSTAGSQSHKEGLIRYWLEKAQESLASAVSEYEANRLSPAVRSTYYACFYALSAVLLQRGKAVKKHSGVRGLLHRELIKTGIVDVEWGRFYDLIFDSRHRGDYHPMVKFEPEQVRNFLEGAKGFLEQMEKLLT